MHIYTFSWCVEKYKCCYFDYIRSGSECTLILTFGRPHRNTSRLLVYWSCSVFSWTNVFQQQRDSKKHTCLVLIITLALHLCTTEQVTFHLATIPEMQKAEKLNYYVQYLVHWLFLIWSVACLSLSIILCVKSTYLIMNDDSTTIIPFKKIYSEDTSTNKFDVCVSVHHTWNWREVPTWCDNLFIIINNSTCFGHLYAHLQEY